MSYDDEERARLEHFGENLRRLRQAAGLTLKQAGEQGDIYWRHLQEMEEGRRPATAEMRVRLARALGVEVEALVVDRSAE